MKAFYPFRALHPGMSGELRAWVEAAVRDSFIDGRAFGRAEGDAARFRALLAGLALGAGCVAFWFAVLA